MNWYNNRLDQRISELKHDLKNKLTKIKRQGWKTGKRRKDIWKTVAEMACFS